MKIEHVSFDNINSLCGHFEVDFTHPSLTDPGIFVITGSTGVGKTSLLDAVSFALYGRTARQRDSVTEYRNELMTRGAPFCRAELRFEKDGIRYIVSTEHRRKRKGNGFGDQIRRLGKMESDGTLSTLATQVTKVAALVRKITGLEFDNFFRCMMLAQGQFAQFLEAEASKRSEVLSTITGTGIYQCVGEIVSAHKAELEKALAEICWQEVLSPEDRAAKEKSLADAEAEKAAAFAEREKTETALKWLGDVARAQNNLVEKRGAQARAEQAMDAFAQDGSAERLRSAESALAVKPFHVQVEETRKNERVEQSAFDKETLWLENNRESLQQAEDAEKRSADSLEQERPRIETTLQWLCEVVRPLEKQVGLAEVAAQAARSQADKAAKGSKDAGDLAAKAKANVASLQALAENAVAEKTRLAADAGLGEQLPAIRQRLKDWAAAPGAKGDVPAHDSLVAREQRLRQEKQTLLAGRSEDELPLLAERMKHLAVRLREETQARADLAKAGSAEQAAQKACDSLGSVEDAEKIYNACREATRLAAQVAGLEEQLNALYLDFRAGKYPCCPCCGSNVPHERPVSPGALQQKRREEEDARLLLETRRKAADSATRALALAKNDTQRAQKACTAAEIKLQEALTALGWEHIPADLETRRTACTTDMQRLGELRRAAEESARLLALDSLREKLCECLRPWCRELPATLPGAQKLVAELENRFKAYRRAEQSAQKATENREKARLELQHAETAAAGAAKNAAETEKAALTAAETLAKRRDNLAQIHAGASSETEEKTLRSKLATLVKAHDTAHRAAESRRAEHGSHLALRNRAGTRLPALAEARQAAENAFAQALADSEFPDEAAYTAACAFIPEKELLQQRRQNLCNTLNANRGAAEEAQKALDALLSQALTAESEEELTARCGMQHALCHEKDELVTSIRSLLLKDDDAHRANREKQAQASGIQQQLNNWGELYAILGGSKFAFKKYAQQITFDILVQHANIQLGALSERYTLLSDPEQELSLRVLDNCRDEAGGRSCSNLSGGESFIVSLALALGLSRMAGNETRIDTLFLDEGFGTLDDACLERVLAGLQNLRAGGKLVGIISHVEKLQARIPANIALEPRGGTGLSTFRPHEAVIAAPANPANAQAPTKAALRQAEAEATRRQAILQALAAGPLIEKDIGTAVGSPLGNRAILKALVAEGLLLYDKPYYRLHAGQSRSAIDD